MSWSLSVTEKIAGGWLSKALRDKHAGMHGSEGLDSAVDTQITHAIRVAEQLAAEVCERDDDGNPTGKVTVNLSGHAHTKGSSPNAISVSVQVPPKGGKSDAG